MFLVGFGHIHSMLTLYIYIYIIYVYLLRTLFNKVFSKEMSKRDFQLFGSCYI